jgi:hypothetical protein
MALLFMAYRIDNCGVATVAFGNRKSKMLFAPQNLCALVYQNKRENFSSLNQCPCNAITPFFQRLHCVNASFQIKLKKKTHTHIHTFTEWKRRIETQCIDKLITYW